MLSREKSRKLWVIPVLLAMTWLMSCGDDPTPTPSPTPSPTPTPSPQALLSDSAAKMAALSSLAFTLKHEVGSTPAEGTIVINELEGQVDLPNQFSLTVYWETLGGIRFDIQAFTDFIVTKEKSYWNQGGPRGGVSGDWEETSTSSVGFFGFNSFTLDRVPFDFSDLGKTLADIMTSMQAPTRGTDETIDDKKTTNLRGTISSKDLAAFIPAAAEDLDVGLELWVEEESLFLVKARIAGRVRSGVGESSDVVRVLTFGAFNEPVTIEPPI